MISEIACLMRGASNVRSAAFAMLLAWIAPELIWAADLPDSSITPGVINEDVTQNNIHNTVCIKGWTRTIRPPQKYTSALKRQQLAQYGLAGKSAREFEEDHLIALSIGGHPTDPKNLWPQARGGPWGAERKDDLEFVLYRMLCTGQIALADAQRAMATDWIEAYKHYVPTHPRFHRRGNFND